LRARGELAVEFGRNRPTGRDVQFGAGGDERGILRRRGAVDDEVCARQGLEYRLDGWIADPIMRPRTRLRNTSGMFSSVVRSSKRAPSSLLVSVAVMDW
jgi:hypothetical protein